ncbi:MAG TPA: pyridoxal 5'-phosphate synthase glutaminase subunit PdxT [Aggregatilineales bacterium]|nr:pyridoxal 5'-phosphate synthase glutaminase subunit PdxT [Aggregatilineales bacterium]
MIRIGVLALQGDFAEHAAMLRKIGVEPVEVRKPQQLDGLDGLIIPGGESTTMRRLAASVGLMEPLRAFAVAHATWGTCAGAILLAKEVEGESMPLGVMNISVRRNAFGRQIDSFTQALSLEGLEGGPFQAVFIRAPIISSVGRGVRVLSSLDDGTIVAAQQGHLLATSFHPELTGDPRVHAMFVEMAKKGRE